MYLVKCLVKNTLQLPARSPSMRFSTCSNERTKDVFGSPRGLRKSQPIFCCLLAWSDDLGSAHVDRKRLLSQAEMRSLNRTSHLSRAAFAPQVRGPPTLPDHRPTSYFSTFVFSPFFPRCPPNRQRQRRRRLGLSPTAPAAHRRRLSRKGRRRRGWRAPPPQSPPRAGHRRTAVLHRPTSASVRGRRPPRPPEHRSTPSWQGRVRGLLSSALAAPLAGSCCRRPRRSSRRRPGT
jgi:hypothetical protein